MPCGACGANTEPDQPFCTACGADLRAAAPPPTPVQPPQPAAPPAPPRQPPPLPSERSVTAQPQRKPGLSGGAIAGIVAGALVVLLLLVAGGFFLLRGAFGPGASSVVVTAPTPPPSTPPAITPTETVEPSTSTSDQAPPGTPDDGIVTDAEARDVVTRFMDYRLAMDVAASKTLCSKNMLTGADTKPLVNDKYWRPESYEIVKTTPDLMYIHVAVMGVWPSGNEPLIFSVWRDPETATVLIDGMLDPANVPELVK
jgi:hypothetical protein